MAVGCALAVLAFSTPAVAQVIPGYDSVTLSTIPSNAEAVGCYTAGFWPTCDAVAKDFPHAARITIAISASLLTFHGAPINCLDIEPGDASISQARAWDEAEIHLGEIPCDYTSESQMPALKAAVTGLHVLFWDAAYDGDPSLRGFDAHQWTDTCLGRNLDCDTFSTSFLADLKLVQPKPAPPRCFGPHARLKLAHCKLVRVEVAKWSRARDATLRAVKADCVDTRLDHYKVVVALRKDAVCVVLPNRAAWFQHQIDAVLY